MKFFIIILIIFLFIHIGISQDTLYHSDTYTITDKAVYEGDFEAIALSANEIKSNYESAFRTGVKRIIKFKFSISGLDNERPPSMDHLVEIEPENGEFVTPVFAFGESDPEEIVLPDKNEIYLENMNSVNVLFRLDMRKVLKEIATGGFYQTFDGSILRNEDFTGVYIAGEEYPLTWNFSDLPNQKKFELTDVDNDSIYEVKINFLVNPDRPIDKDGYSHWKLSQDISGFPIFSSQNLLLNALYNLSLEELILNIRSDSTFMAGAKWPGVWTRDISYSSLLSLAALSPDIARRSLLAKVKNGKIIQDTGTGGSWPVSTDRMTWALAAWEIYCVTGDKNWLTQSYQIIRKSAATDIKSILDTQTGLFYGESSFLDWREQSYPAWMDPKDIFMSLNLSTNIVHYQTYKILHQMADILGEPANKFQQIAKTLKNAINTYFWLAEKGYYGQYIYGRNFKTLSQRSETLGEALAVLFEIAGDNQNKKTIANTPILNYGVPCFFPQIAELPSYHNNGIWPFVQSFWTWAAAKSGNSKAVNYGLASISRSTALFLTNKENFVATTGNFLGTEINSDRQLWSVAGNLAMFYRIIFGMNFQSDGLHFQPLIPESYSGKYFLENFNYRNANLNITVEGFGNVIDSFFIDNKYITDHYISTDLKGNHFIRIKLSNALPLSSINIVENHFTPTIKGFEYDGDELDWEDVDNDPVYIVIRNGKVYRVTQDSDLEIPESEKSVEFQVVAVDKNGYQSFLSKPVWIKNEQEYFILQPDEKNNKLHSAYEGFTGNGYIPLTIQQNRKAIFTIDVNKMGFYSIDFRYANGNGPINTDDKCGIRTLRIDEKNIGTIVLPQRGLHQWTNWGYSNSFKIHLLQGKHTIELIYYDFNENMNVKENVAFIDHLRLRYLNPK